MNKEIDLIDNHEDVVVIEERDKRTIIYIVIAMVLGAAIGGLVGSIATKNKWESAYVVLENKLKKTQREQTKLIASKEIKALEIAEAKVNIDNEVNKRVASEVEIIIRENKAEKQKLQEAVVELEKVNIELEKKTKSQLKEINNNTETITQLKQKTAVQVSIFERSRELFQRELLIKQDLTRLQKEREELESKLDHYQRECDAYSAGASFNLNSGGCDKLDKANSKISQLTQMIEVHTLDLKEIKNILDNIGL